MMGCRPVEACALAAADVETLEAAAADSLTQNCS
jgi:hypothetical protein